MRMFAAKQDCSIIIGNRRAMLGSLISLHTFKRGRFRRDWRRGVALPHFGHPSHIRRVNIF